MRLHALIISIIPPSIFMPSIPCMSIGGLPEGPFSAATVKVPAASMTTAIAEVAKIFGFIKISIGFQRFEKERRCV
jgi:hypothetical protein